MWPKCMMEVWELTFSPLFRWRVPCGSGTDWREFHLGFSRDPSSHASCVFNSVQSHSRVRLCDPMDCSTPGLPVHHELLEFTQTQVHWGGDAINHLILCRPLLLLPSIFPGIRVFSNESALRIRWPKYWSFSFSISPSSEHPGLISFRMNWLDLLVLVGIFPTLLSPRLQPAKATWWIPSSTTVIPKPAILGLLQIPVTHEALKSPPALLQTEASGFTSTPAS